MDFIGIAGCMVFLLPCVYADIERKKINKWWMLINGITASAAGVLTGRGVDMLIAASPGVILLLLGASTKGIGLSDGVMVMLSGMYLFIYRIIPSILYAFLLCSIIGIVSGIKTSHWRGKRICFSPCLIIGILLTVVGESFV